MLLGPSIKTVLLDVDGTLINSNHEHALAWQKALQEAGYEVGFSALRSKIGMGGDNLLPSLLSLEADSPEGKKISERRGEIFRSEFLPSLKAFPGTRELLKLLRARGYRLTIATSASAEDLGALLRQCGLEELIDLETNSSEAESSKPDPDIIVAALRKSRTKTAEAVMIGDTPYDLEAAKKAGVRSIAFTCGGWDQMYLQQAVEIYEGPWELLTALSG